MQQENRYERAIEMKSDSVVTVELTLARRHCRRIREEGPSPEPIPRPTSNQPPRITRLMALAIKFQEMVDRGEVRDYADLARLGHVSRARATQIMNLLHLAPTIQENILLSPRFAASCASERSIRKITSLVFWADQLDTWNELPRPRSPAMAEERSFS